jgi:DNA-binding CsgD family transcriptional regulator
MAAITLCKYESYYGDTMPLNDLLNEVMKLKAAGKKTKLLSDEQKKVIYNTDSANIKKNCPVRVKSLVAYGLGSKYGRAYFTRREAECMVLLLKGKTINSVARILKLSPRTVEYYIKNMKSKLGCRTKFELVDLVYASDFMNNVDF